MIIYGRFIVRGNPLKERVFALLRRRTPLENDKFSLTGVVNQIITIPVQNLAAGKYWLHLQAGNEKQVLQFVKQ